MMMTMMVLNEDDDDDDDDDDEHNDSCDQLNLFLSLVFLCLKRSLTLPPLIKVKTITK